MSFVVLQGEVRIDGKTAKSEIKDLERAQDKLKKSTKSLSGEGKKAASSNRKMGGAVRKATADVKRLSNAERIAATDARTLGRANQVAAGQIGNLTAQFNDIGVMLMAGQNPLQLAIQQGTQITQVIGPMGAAGAVSALKSGFMSMLSPISLITIGSIAAGSAMVNWLTSAGEDAETLEDMLGDLTESVDAYVASAKRARASDADLADLFGAAAAEGRGLSRSMAEIGRAGALEDMRASARELAEEFGGLSRQSIAIDIAGYQMTEYELSISELGNKFDLTSGQATQLVLALENIGKAETPEDAVRQAENFSDVLLQVFGTAKLIPAQFKEAAKEIEGLALDAGKMLAQDQVDPFAENLAAIADYLDKTSAVTAKQQAAAEDMLATLKEENTLRWAIVKFGEDSVEVAVLRREAEQRANEEMLATLPVSEALKDEIRAAFLEWQNLSNLDASGTISAAADEAARLADNLATAQGNRIDKLVGGNVDFFDPRNETGTSGVITRPRPNPQVSSGSRRGSIGGGGGADAQAQAIARLIEQQQLQLAVLRESDPVMREMLRYRVAMAGATKEQRALLEKLITTRLREEDVLERVQETQSFFQDTAYDALDGMISRGESFADVMKNVAASIAQAALQAALLGTGPLASLFGSAGGGLLGFIGNALFPAIPAGADGGYLSGPGTGTSDDILMWGSNGEFMVNAAATARHRGLLEAINSGATPPELAAGGLIATSPPSRFIGAGSSKAGSGQINDPAAVTLRILPSREFNTRIEETAERISVEVVTGYDRDVIPGTIQRVLENPRRVG